MVFDNKTAVTIDVIFGTLAAISVADIFVSTEDDWVGGSIDDNVHLGISILSDGVVEVDFDVVFVVWKAGDVSLDESIALSVDRDGRGKFSTGGVGLVLMPATDGGLINH